MEDNSILLEPLDVQNDTIITSLGVGQYYYFLGTSKGSVLVFNSFGKRTSKHDKAFEPVNSKHGNHTTDIVCDPLNQHLCMISNTGQLMVHPVQASGSSWGCNLRWALSCVAMDPDFERTKRVIVGSKGGKLMCISRGTFWGTNEEMIYDGGSYFHQLIWIGNCLVALSTSNLSLFNTQTLKRIIVRNVDDSTKQPHMCVFDDAKSGQTYLFVAINKKLTRFVLNIEPQISLVQSNDISLIFSHSIVSLGLFPVLVKEELIDNYLLVLLQTPVCTEMHLYSSDLVHISGSRTPVSASIPQILLNDKCVVKNFPLLNSMFGDELLRVLCINEGNLYSMRAETAVDRISFAINSCQYENAVKILLTLEDKRTQDHTLSKIIFLWVNELIEQAKAHWMNGNNEGIKSSTKDAFNILKKYLFDNKEAISVEHNPILIFVKFMYLFYEVRTFEYAVRVMNRGCSIYNEGIEYLLMLLGKNDKIHSETLNTSFDVLACYFVVNGVQLTLMEWTQLLQPLQFNNLLLSRYVDLLSKLETNGCINAFHLFQFLFDHVISLRVDERDQLINQVLISLQHLNSNISTILPHDVENYISQLFKKSKGIVQMNIIIDLLQMLRLYGFIEAEFYHLWLFKYYHKICHLENQNFEKFYDIVFDDMFQGDTYLKLQQLCVLWKQLLKLKRFDTIEQNEALFVRQYQSVVGQGINKSELLKKKLETIERFFQYFSKENVDGTEFQENLNISEEFIFANYLFFMKKLPRNICCLKADFFEKFICHILTTVEIDDDIETIKTIIDFVQPSFLKVYNINDDIIKSIISFSLPIILKEENLISKRHHLEIVAEMISDFKEKIHYLLEGHSSLVFKVIDANFDDMNWNKEIILNLFATNVRKASNCILKTNIDKIVIIDMLKEYDRYLFEYFTMSSSYFKLNQSSLVKYHPQIIELWCRFNPMDLLNIIKSMDPSYFRFALDKINDLLKKSEDYELNQQLLETTVFILEKLHQTEEALLIIIHRYYVNTKMKIKEAVNLCVRHEGLLERLIDECCHLAQNQRSYEELNCLIGEIYDLSNLTLLNRVIEALPGDVAFSTLGKQILSVLKKFRNAKEYMSSASHLARCDVNNMFESVKQKQKESIFFNPEDNSRNVCACCYESINNSHVVDQPVIDEPLKGLKPVNYGLSNEGTCIHFCNHNFHSKCVKNVTNRSSIKKNHAYSELLTQRRRLRYTFSKNKEFHNENFLVPNNCELCVVNISK
eukprot:TRINITY_DN3208_c0_g1_i1.p1 TRINITY_DN3208_c0_g1~~TRINITY_DN3208_c0_g1_i1.p1  ORF type:complete len:1240 (+),score=311.92 TRINITY_DN3208_c0_g1_i1:47-3766(+)